jgi:hypothetical protein
MPSKICVSPTGVVSFLSPLWCRLYYDRHRHAPSSYRASFPWSQDELVASASSFSNVLSHRLPSQVKTKTLNLHLRCRPPSLDRPALTLRCYKKVILTSATLSTTQPCLHFASFLSLLAHVHHPSAQQHI